MDENDLNFKNASETSEKGNDLIEAVRRARIEFSEKSGIVSDLKAAEFSRLELLKNNLEPIFAQLPRDADLFNHGLVSGVRPRLYVDMIAFVDVGRDRRTYRFLMDTPSGRQMLGESDDVAILKGAITNYLGRRLVEREHALEQAMTFESIEQRPNTMPLELDHAGSIATMPVITEIRRPDRGRIFVAFIVGIVAGVAAVYAGVNWDTVLYPEIFRLMTILNAR
jgi:hypothetical protein